MMLAAEPLLDLGDPTALAFAFIGVALFVAIGALSHAEERAFSAAVIYLAIGIVASLLLEVGLGRQILDPVDDGRFVEVLTTGALVVALFATGLRVRRDLRLRAWAAPLRLLLVAMPLTIAAVAAWGWAVIGLSLGAAIALGAALAPTDPVLAGDLGLRPPDEQAREEQEEQEEQATEAEFALTNEAGLNDGAALPFALLGIVVATGEGGRLGEWAWADLGYGVLVGIVLGGMLGHGLGRLSRWLRGHGLLVADLDGWIGLACAPLVYGAAEAIGTYGFLAVFAAGVGFHRQEAPGEYEHRVHDGVAIAKSFAELAVLLVLGSMVTIAGLREPGLAGWLLAPVLLLVVRPLSVFASLIGSGTSWGGRIYLGWFGIKGIASLNYMALVVAAEALSGADERKLAWTVIVVVSISIVVHGVTGTPLSARLLRGAGRG